MKTQCADCVPGQCSDCRQIDRAYQRGTAKPFLKWAGGKRKLLKVYEPLFPKHINGYFEPMLGGGAVFFHLAGRCDLAVLGDLNADLMTAWRVVRDFPEQLCAALEALAMHHDEDLYRLWRSAKPDNAFGRALRVIYLNRAGFNGLQRENRRGENNVPIGRKKLPDGTSITRPGHELFDLDNLRRVSRVLNSGGINVLTGPYQETTRSAMAGDFVYVDPPYYGTFAGYTAAGFGPEDHELLAAEAEEWHDRGCLVMISNSDHPAVRRLFTESHWNLTAIESKQSIAADASARGRVRELVIRNYT